MKKYEENKQLLKSIVTQHRHGYMQTLKYKHPELINWVNEVTSFANWSNRSFITRIWYILNDIHEYPICKNCKKPITKNIYRLADPRMDFCCCTCASYCPEAVEKRKRSYIKNFGVDNPSKSPTIHAKIMKSQAVTFARKKAKKEESLKNQPTSPHYGRNNTKKRNYYLNVISQNEFIKPLFTADEYMSLTQKERTGHLFLWQCKKCGKVFRSELKWFFVPNANHYKTFARCYNCFPLFNNASLEEKHLAKFMSEQCPADLEVINNKLDNMKLIAPFQVDIIVRDRLTKEVKLCVEYNGARWHSIEEGSEIDRQLNKTKLCEKLGIPLVHIYEDEWLDIKKHKTLQQFLIMLMNGQNVFDLTRNTIEVNRDKYACCLKPYGFELVAKTDVEIVKRYSMVHDIEYSVPNC